MDEIHFDLLLTNWDKTMFLYHFGPMVRQGAKRIEIVGVDDKPQIATMFGGSLAGDFLTSAANLQARVTSRNVYHHSTFPPTGTLHTVPCNH